MTVGSKRAVVFGAITTLLLVGGLIVSSSALRWRVQVVTLKLQGSLADITWEDLFETMRPGQKSLDPESLLSSSNLYRSISNPFGSGDDAASGAKIYRSSCAPCHGIDGTGGAGPDLTPGEFRHGVTDWALFNTVRRGIPGTKMEGQDLPYQSVWQVVTFVRSLIRKAGQEEAASNIVSPPNAIYDRLVKALQEPGSWLTYSGSYTSQRHSRLQQINQNNVRVVRPKWVFQMDTSERLLEATPLVIDGVMYLSEPTGNVLALDAGNGRELFSFRRNLPRNLPICCGRVNRGLAVLENTLYVATLDAHLVAVDARTGSQIWDKEVIDYRTGYSMTGAPLAVKDKIIVGVAGGEFGIRGFLDAYDAKTGERVWRFHTIPGPGEQGHETWSGGSWKTGAGPTWLTGSFDPELNLIYWGVGNPGPSYRGDLRPGDNLYTNCVIALDADTGKLKWYFQFTPHDEHDYDAVQIPVLSDSEFRGRKRKLMLWANRNAFYYVLDRETGEFLLARQFAKQTWAKGIDAKGRPIVNPEASPKPEGTLVSPGAGATNWWSPTYSPQTELFYVPTLEESYTFFGGSGGYRPGEHYEGSTVQYVPKGSGALAVRALKAKTGELEWEYRITDEALFSQTGGLLSTAGNLVFGGARRTFFALDASSGKELWRFNTGGEIIAAPITYLSRGKQRVSICAGRSVFTFGLDEE